MLRLAPRCVSYVGRTKGGLTVQRALFLERCLGTATPQDLDEVQVIRNPSDNYTYQAWKEGVYPGWCTQGQPGALYNYTENVGYLRRTGSPSSKRKKGIKQLVERLKKGTGLGL